MDLLWALIDYLRNHPAWLIGVGVFFGLYFLLDRKTELTRQADLRLGELRKDSSDHYRKLRSR